ncbi:glycoside hydrolase family 31 protein [Lewinella cohaerens]|uniref:glycoside hydrolase family 31 protein n=1 Tax=Lewinella cohaerens TaxID=70995 RepID=UPI00037921AC|nr:glycoside hydrolase family 31 protein [Lewinella cohaerens]
MARKTKKRAPFDPAPHLVADTATETSQRYPDVFQIKQINKVIKYQKIDDNTLEITTEGEIKLRVELWTDTTWRVRYAVEKFSTQPSYALHPDREPKSVDFTVKEDKQQIFIISASVSCRIQKKDCRISFHTKDGKKTILEEQEPYLQRATILDGTDHLRVSFKAPKEEVFYGLGDKSWSLNLRGRSFDNWNSDAFGYHKEKDPLYRAVPFYYGLQNDQAYGIFLHNTWRTHFDFASQKDETVRMWAEGGEIDYFFCYGPELNQVAQSYHQLTGTPELPPLWALGFHQCRWSYYPEARVRKLADTFRELQIPCDAIYLDIDYMDGYRCFTWNQDYFPKPGEMIRDIAEQGFQTVVMIDPGIRVDEDYHVYKQGVEKDYFCRRANGELMRGPVWPADCVWPDYTRADVREWWGELYRELYEDNSISGFWNDMNEPAVFKVNSLTFPDHVMHDNDGHPSDHKPVHNIYGQQMSRGTYDGLKSIKPEKRPFVLTRASFSGGQRYAAVWTGDNVASWEHLELANRQCQRLSISGFSLVGTDIGGFVNQPSPELLIRWLQLGIFHPVFRVHSMGNNIDGAAEADADAIKASEATLRLDQEPWVFGEPYTSQARTAIEFRYRLLPYLYTSVYQNVTQGTPVLRSLAFEDQTDKKAQKRENEFMLGDHLLVSPVVKPGVKSHNTYLPSGDWVNYYNGNHYAGPRNHRQSVKEDTIPLYVRGGAIIPNYPVQQYVYELNIETVELRAYYGKNKIESSFYQDAGEGYEHEKGQYRHHKYTTSSGKNSFLIKQKTEGKYEGDLSAFEIKLFGLPFEPQQLLIDGVAIQVIDKEGDAYVIVAPSDFKTVEVKG